MISAFAGGPGVPKVIGDDRGTGINCSDWSHVVCHCNAMHECISGREEKKTGAHHIPDLLRNRHLQEYQRRKKETKRAHRDLNIPPNTPFLTALCTISEMTDLLESNT
jgi:hypothetical protein